MAQNSVPIDGSVVRKRRKARFVTQGELAAAIGVHPNTISMIENDPSYQCSFATIRALAANLGCEPTELLLETEVAS